MKNLFQRYAIFVLTIIFLLVCNTCKKSTTSSDKEEAPEINVAVQDINIVNDTGSFNFGEITLGETSVVVTFTIENIGTGLLNLDGSPIVAILGQDSSMFTITAQPSATVSVNDATSFNLIFNPSSEGNKVASVSISNNDTDENPYNFTINGLCVQGVLTTTDIAEKFQSLIAVTEASTVYIIGPVEESTIIKENNIDSQNSVELQLPNSVGEYYIFIIDDTPELMFEHSVRYAWINVNDDTFAIIDASYPGTIYQPGITPEPFSNIESFELSNVTYMYLEGEGQPTIHDYTHKNIYPNTVSKIQTGFNNYLDNTDLTFKPERSPMKMALVIDAGDADELWDMATELYENHAKPIADWVRDKGFETEQGSQSWDNAEWCFDAESSTEFLDEIASYGQTFTTLLEPDYGCDEFFLYITGHGQKNAPGGAFNLYKPDGGGDFQRVYYRHILERIKSTFPSWVKVTIFIDACWAGKAISDNSSVISELCDHLCALTIITSSDDETGTPRPDAIWSDSGTEDFLQGASEDNDGDGNIGDIQDRFKEMEDQNSDYGPMSMHCPEGGAWCSLDGPTSCEEQEHLYNLMNPWYNIFGYEPCSAVMPRIYYDYILNSWIWGVPFYTANDQTTTYGWGHFPQIIDQSQWGSNLPFDRWEPGIHERIWNGSQWNPQKSLSTYYPQDTENWVIFFNVVEQDIPAADPDNQYQYGFVFDRDGNTNNNYQPHPDYANDFFKDTDFWIVADYHPDYGWGLTVSDVTNGVVTSAISTAKVLLSGNTLIVFVPRSEFPAQTIGYRVTAFRHDGSWANDVNAGADTQPSVSDGLQWIDIGPE